MLETAVAYNKYKFLGNEFLTWLWYIIENDRAKLISTEGEAVSLEIGKRIVLELVEHDVTMETLTIKGDNADLGEGLMAIRKGSFVTELNLSFTEGSQNWVYTLKGESFNFSGLKHPTAAPVENKDEIEGFILEKMFLVDKATAQVDALFRQFIKLRISAEPWLQTTTAIKTWIGTHK